MKYSVGEAIATRLREDGMTKVKAEAIGRDVEKLLEENLRAGDTVVLGSIGFLERVHSNGRAGRNPQTGAPLAIPDQYKVRFHPYRAFKKHLNS